VVHVIEPLSSGRARIERVVRRLHETDDPTERADLGAELVRAVSRYEDTLERSLLPRLRGVVPDAELYAQEQRREMLREAMSVVHRRTMHIDPRNVHASDPEGFEQALDDVVRCVEEQLPAEDHALDALVEQTPPGERDRLAEAVTSAARRASERPRPPRTAVGRLFANANVRLDHAFEDVATPQHPGSDVIDGEQGAANGTANGTEHRGTEG
jgi:hypothetical protein